jgi:hypothetical protein
MTCQAAVTQIFFWQIAPLLHYRASIHRAINSTRSTTSILNAWKMSMCSERVLRRAIALVRGTSASVQVLVLMGKPESQLYQDCRTVDTVPKKLEEVLREIDHSSSSKIGEPQRFEQKVRPKPMQNLSIFCDASVPNVCHKLNRLKYIRVSNRGIQ